MKNKQAEPDGQRKELQGISIVGKIVGLIVMIWLTSLSYYAFAFFMLGMMPAIVAMIVDRGAGKFASQTVSACNFIGILPFLFDIGFNYEKSLAAKEAMRDPYTWSVVYGSALIGVILIYVLPNITAIIFTINAEIKLRRLNAEQEKLIDEWGERVKTGK